MQTLTKIVITGLVLSTALSVSAEASVVRNILQAHRRALVQTENEGPREVAVQNAVANRNAVVAAAAPNAAPARRVTGSIGLCGNAARR